jgi:hypothetical protein
MVERDDIGLHAYLSDVISVVTEFMVERDDIGSHAYLSDVISVVTEFMVERHDIGLHVCWAGWSKRRQA